MRDSTLCLPTQPSGPIKGRRLLRISSLSSFLFSDSTSKSIRLQSAVTMVPMTKDEKSPEDKNSSAFRLRHFAHNKAMVARRSRHISKRLKATLLFLELRSDNKNNQKKRCDLPHIHTQPSDNNDGHGYSGTFLVFDGVFLWGDEITLKKIYQHQKHSKSCDKLSTKCKRTRRSLIIATLCTVAGLLAGKVNLLTT